jgi:ubiquinone/menaquinone biosynthesis C-methylase UbiE
LSDDSVDVCVCDSVLEHVEHPDSFFSESRRVLRNGGYLCIRTPNAWGYVALFSRLTSERHHVTILSRVQAPEDRKEEQDIFPAYYRCNTIPKLRKMLGGHGFEHAVYGHAAEPSYLHFSKIAYWLGVLHQRFAPGLLRPALFAFGRVAK